MKNLILFVTLLIFIIRNPEAAKEGGVPAPVEDTDGEQLRVGTHYYIQALMRDSGVGLYPLPNTTCAYGVSHELFGSGLPLSFSPSTNGDVIHESTDLNIMFSTTIGCGSSTVWRLVKSDVFIGAEYFVVTGGVAGNPGSETVNNWFKIEKAAADDYYKLSFCPTAVCDSCAVTCGDVGVFFTGFRSLALTNFPLSVKFQKVLSGHNEY